MAGISKKLFNYRSYTPIPFLILIVIFASPTIASLVVGFIIALSGEYLRLWGVSWAGSETRTTGGVGGSFLIISGPFAYIRNPLYVGNILLYVGIGIMSWALFPYLQVAALIFFTMQYHFIVLEEEGYLFDEFNDYGEYCKQVPRFYPRLTPYKNSLVQQPPFSLKAGLRSEQRSLQAFVGVTLIIVIIWIVRYS
ncbi:MAG: isoprenylcysteine carboxylmethyltransferase family protein [Ignavibacteria bacterium]|nr:isoprenylcysteine carboxylmethyltransferase family protein [Ignavibacteria bacterium]